MESKENNVYEELEFNLKLPRNKQINIDYSQDDDHDASSDD